MQLESSAHSMKEYTADEGTARWAGEKGGDEDIADVRVKGGARKEDVERGR